MVSLWSADDIPKQSMRWVTPKITPKTAVALRDANCLVVMNSTAAVPAACIFFLFSTAHCLSHMQYSVFEFAKHLMLCD